MVENTADVLPHSFRALAVKPTPKMNDVSVCQKPPDIVHFPVGVELAHEDLGDRTSPRFTASSSPIFIRGIMHKAVSARSFVARVQYDASAAAIAAAVGAPEQDVENLWLAGVRTPAKRTIDRRALSSKDLCMRFTPQSVLDSSIISSDTGAAPVTEAERACKDSGLEKGQFADLFQEDRKIDHHCIEFGNALIGKLEALAGTSRAFPRYQPPTKRRSMRTRSLDASSEDCVLQLDPSNTRDADSERRCGFSKRGSHTDLDLRCDGFAICKNGKGLYRSARGSSQMRQPEDGDDSVSFYFEVVIVDDKDSGGICVGVGTQSLALNKLVGSNTQSCGLHSSGQLVLNNGEFREFGKGFKKGDRIGCMVKLNCGYESVDPQTPLHSHNSSYSETVEPLAAMTKSQEEEVEVTFFVNGERQGRVREALWRDVREEERSLFPIVSLYKRDSKAVIQCCSKNWAARPREVDDGVMAVCGNDDDVHVTSV